MLSCYTGGDGRGGIANDLYSSGYAASSHLMGGSTYPASPYTTHLTNPASVTGSTTQLVSHGI